MKRQAMLINRVTCLKRKMTTEFNCAFYMILILPMKYVSLFLVLGRVGLILNILQNNCTKGVNLIKFNLKLKKNIFFNMVRTKRAWKRICLLYG